MTLPWTMTRSGVKFTPTAPKAVDVKIQDIAHALSNLCRWGGHSRFFYSVAEHCVRASHAVEPVHALAVLLHDASEAYCADLPTPIKYLPELKAYRTIEDRIHAAIGEAFGIDWKKHKTAIKAADNLMLWLEDDDLMHGRLTEAEGLAATTADMATTYLMMPSIIPWSPEQARHQYLKRFFALQPPRE